MTKDYTGRKYASLTFIRFSHCDKKRNKYWLCKCDCGKEKIIRMGHVLAGKTKSCGCLSQARASCRMHNNKLAITHGYSKTSIYKRWAAIKRRCFLKSCSAYKNYGGRGITMCKEWKNSFVSFYEWAINNGYQDNLTIDRINVNGDYCPENCRWVDNFVQQNNKRNNRIVFYKGQRYTFTQLSKMLHIPPTTLDYRLKHNTLI